jgi:hypothetical protein
MSSIGKALDKFKHYRQTEEGKKPAVYTRHYKGGGMSGHQLIAGKHVLSLHKNKSGSNGDVHGWKLEHSKREKTNL